MLCTACTGRHSATKVTARRTCPALYNTASRAGISRSFVMLRQALSASLATPSALLACCCSQLSTQQLWLRSGYGQSLPGADAVSTSSSAPQAAPQFPSSRQFSSSSHPGDAAGSSKSEKAEEGSQPATTSAASAPSQPSLETLASALHRSNRSRQHG